MDKEEFEKLPWTPIRHRYPGMEDVEYWIKDCRYNIYGHATYNGYDFELVEWRRPTKGALIWIEYIVTHWALK